MKLGVVGLTALLLSLIACGELVPVPQPTAAPTPTIAPTETQVPTAAAVLPTETPAPTAIPTHTPLGQVFRDDFSGALAPGWTWENEDPSRWTITPDGWLQIIGQDASLIHEGTQSNLLWHDLPAGDFRITVHLKANPTDNFQQATIYIYENGENYIALNRGYCAPCVSGGNAVYMEYKISGLLGAYNAPVTATDLYLRLVSQGTVLSGYYSLAGTDWIRLGRFGNYFAFKRVGLGVSNVDTKGINADLAGQFDFFEITRP